MLFRSTLNMLLANSGMAHTPAEYGAAITRLLSYGWSDSDIARKLGKSRQWIANTLEAAAMPEEVQQLVAVGAVSGTLARQLVRSEGSGAAETIKRAAGATGRAHVTARHLRVVETAPQINGKVAPLVHPEPAAEPVVSDDLTIAVRAFLRLHDDGGTIEQTETAIARMRSFVS